MRRDDMIKQGHPFKDDISDIECCQEPCILAWLEGQRRFQSSDARVADIWQMKKVSFSSEYWVVRWRDQWIGIVLGANIGRLTRSIEKAHHVQQGHEKNKSPVKYASYGLIFLDGIRFGEACHPGQELYVFVRFFAWCSGTFLIARSG